MMKRPYKVVAGYLISVLTASAATASVVTSSTSEGVHAFVMLMLFGSVYVILCGLPGFMLTVYLSRAYALRGWLFFAFAGAANAIAAWLTLSLFTGSSIPLGETLFTASIVGGLAGGTAYWSIAERSSQEFADSGPAA